MNDLLPTPGAGFDQPFELLAACHDRVRRTLDLLHRLVAHVHEHGADEQARAAAADVLRYFDIAAPAHHEDEERHVFPLLRESGDPALVAAAERLHEDHVAMARQWRVLAPLLRAVAGGGPADAPALAPAAHVFAALYDGHLALEDGQVFGAAQAALPPDALPAMGDEMAARRGVARA